MLHASKKSLLEYLATRTIMYFATIFSGITLTYLLVKAMPVDAVENIIFGLTQTVAGVYDPQSINKLREDLYEIFGLTGKSPLEDYLIFIRRVFTFNFGPSFISFPTPAFELVLRRLPWTIGLLSVSTAITWITGNLLGTIAGYFRTKKFTKVLESIAISLYPVPYYIMALILMLLFAFLIPIFPLGGGISVIPESINLELILNIIWHSLLPALSLILPGALGWSFLSSRTLTLEVLSEDYTRYAEFRGLPGKYVLRRYVLRNILVPQVTVLALSLGGIFSGALLTEVIFAYPGVGSLAYRAAFAGDINTLMAVLILSMIAVSTAIYLLDLLYPLVDPRIRYR
ncbi:ABC transporter permease [Candidatus Bathyarchaeota archaeon]|nr:ABC transporter permease [Candidatus Bathyarchaeota archaeon]